MKKKINQYFDALARVFDGDRDWQTFVEMERKQEREHRSYIDGAFEKRVAVWKLSRNEAVRLMCVRNMLRARLSIGTPCAEDFFTTPHVVFAAYALWRRRSNGIAGAFPASAKDAFALLEELDKEPA